MPMFIITGSMISAATSSPTCPRARSRAFWLLNGTIRVFSAVLAGTPFDVGTVM